MGRSEQRTETRSRYSLATICKSSIGAGKTEELTKSYGKNQVMKPRLGELGQEGFGFLQILRVKPFGEPVVDLG